MMSAYLRSVWRKLLNVSADHSRVRYWSDVNGLYNISVLDSETRGLIGQRRDEEDLRNVDEMCVRSRLNTSSNPLLTTRRIYPEIIYNMEFLQDERVNLALP